VNSFIFPRLNGPCLDPFSLKADKRGEAGSVLRLFLDGGQGLPAVAAGRSASASASASAPFAFIGRASAKPSAFAGGLGAGFKPSGPSAVTPIELMAGTSWSSDTRQNQSLYEAGLTVGDYLGGLTVPCAVNICLRSSVTEYGRLLI
jgi:hypothetical protein